MRWQHSIFLIVLMLAFPARAEETSCHTVKGDGVFPIAQGCPDDVEQLITREKMCYRFLQGGWTDDQIDVYVASHKDLVPYHCKGVPCTLQDLMTHKYKNDAPIKNALTDAVAILFGEDAQKMMNACK